MTKHIVITGITGSIGTQTVAIANELGYKIVGCSYHTNDKLAKNLIKSNKIKYVYCSSNKQKENCSSFDQLIKLSKPDLVVNAIIGFAGLEATIASIKNKIDIALANKESMVVAGHFITKLAKKNKIKIIPIDSEHTNLYKQLLEVDAKKVNQLFITGSGGKYWNKKPSNISYDEATTHNNWSMGQKITIDSNTLMNKCFEVVEAYWYFKTKRIGVLRDKTSIIHSAILLNDGSFIYSHSKPTMTLPICWAINDFVAPNKYIKQSYAQPTEQVLEKIDQVEPIKWAYDIINDKTHSLGIIINAADEVAIRMFKDGLLKYNQIIPFVANAARKIKRKTIKNIDEIYDFNIMCKLASIKKWK